MLLKLIYDKHFMIISNVDSIDVTEFTGEEKNLIVRTINYFDKSINTTTYAMTETDGDLKRNICVAFLMNNKGETIEGIK